MTTIDVYARVSRMSDKRDLSTNGQVIENKEIVVERGYQVGMVHVDSGKSAWNPRVFREGWQALMQRLETGQADGVIVFDMSRFARRAEDGLRLLRIAELGVKVMDSEGEYDLSKPKAAKAFRDAISGHEYESAMIGERTKRGKRRKVADRKEANTSTRAFGFELGNVTPRACEAAELVKAAEQLVQGVTAQHICDDLNARGVHTTLGNEWMPRSLMLALTRPANVGDIVHNGVIKHVGVNPGILERDLYERVQAVYAARRRGRPVVNLGTGFLVCAHCQRRMHCKPLSSSNHYTPYPDGTPMKVYVCVKRRGTGCGQQVDWRDTDEYLRKLTLTVLADPRTADAIESKAAALGDELDKVSGQILELGADLDYLDEALINGMDRERHAKLTAGKQQKLAELRAEQARLVANAPQRAETRMRASLATWEKRWKTADMARQREYIRQAFQGRVLLVSRAARLDPLSGRCVFSGADQGGQRLEG